MIKNHYKIKDELGRRNYLTIRLARKTRSGNAFGTQTEVGRNDSDWTRKNVKQTRRPDNGSLPVRAAKHYSGENSGDRTVSGELDRTNSIAKLEID